MHVHVNDVGRGDRGGGGGRSAVPDLGDPLRRPGGAGPARAAARPDGRAAVVVAAGAGIAELFAAEGATVVPGNPSTGELLDAIRATGAAPGGGAAQRPQHPGGGERRRRGGARGSA